MEELAKQERQRQQRLLQQPPAVAWAQGGSGRAGSKTSTSLLQIQLEETKSQVVTVRERITVHLLQPSVVLVQCVSP